MKTSASLHRHWSRRLDWAHEAIDDFRDQLAPEVKHLLPGQGKLSCNVAVYGKSQVGKTTLILRLMGVDSGEVDAVLRAGRPEGNSSTSTAIFYRRSYDEKWHASLGDLESAADKDGPQMVRWLQSIRNRVERGEVFPDPIKLFIPARYFDGAAVPVEILDLPGIDSSADKEKQHVAAVAEKYLPIMEVVLIVSKTNHLLHLFPDPRCGIPFLENWRSIPTRFRFVSTYALTPQTMRDRFLREPLTAEALRARISQEAAAFLRDQELITSLPNLLFPVDVGSSWQELKENHPELYQRARPVMEEILSGLRSTIVEASDTWSRVAAPFGWYRQIRNYQQKVQEERTEQVQKAQRLIDSLRKKKEAMEASLAEVADRTSDNQTALRQARGKNYSFADIKTASDFSSCDTVSALQKGLGAAERAVIGAAVSIIEQHNQWCREAFWRRSGIIEQSEQEIETAVTGSERGKEMRRVRAHLSSYTFDPYFFNWFTNNLDEDQDTCQEAVDELVKVTRELAAGWTENGIDRIVAELENQASSLVASGKVLQAHKDTLKRDIDREEENLRQLEKDFALRLDEIQKSLLSAGKFRNFLKGRWRGEMSRRWESIRREKNPAWRLFDGCVFLQLHRDMKKFEDRT